MNAKAAIALGATAILAALAACSDTATGPSKMTALSTPSFATGDVVSPTPAPVLGKIYVCKAGNVGGSFDVTRVAVGASTGTTTGLNTNIATGTCVEVATDNGGDGIGSTVTIDEDAAANTVSTVTTCTFQSLGGQPQSCNFTDGGSVFLNSFHAYVITYTNTFTPPPPPPSVCDFSTFGGFTLENNFNISYGGNAGIIDVGTAYGDLQFTNHTTGDKIHVWNVTGYGHPATGPLSSYPDSRFASGMGEINGAGSFPVEFRFVDLGEPGTSDRVWLKVNGAVLIQEQVVQGGNVQLHDLCKKAPTAEKH